MEKDKKKCIIRKIIYFILFALIILGFLGISKKYANNHLEQVDSKNTLLVKPVINIKADDLLGTGTKSDPYKLKEE